LAPIEPSARGAALFWCQHDAKIRTKYNFVNINEKRLHR
jgi:hypothetical protein